VAKLTNPQSHKSVTAIIGAEAQAVEDIPAGGHGQITFRDPGGSLVGVMASADVHVTSGSRVRIVGTKGLNPLVVPDTPQT
jgi:membrane-bound ClpP family serine protease